MANTPNSSITVICLQSYATKACCLFKCQSFSLVKLSVSHCTLNYNTNGFLINFFSVFTSNLIKVEAALYFTALLSMYGKYLQNYRCYSSSKMMPCTYLFLLMIKFTRNIKFQFVSVNNFVKCIQQNALIFFNSEFLQLFKQEVQHVYLYNNYDLLSVVEFLVYIFIHSK